MLLSNFKLWKLVVFCIATLPELIVGLRNVNVRIPSAVKRGDNALLICNYDIEDDTLYAVKWYRGRREFYRYTPKEKPAWKIFTKTNEIEVETAQSNGSHLLLRNVPTSISGKFACEVSADAPTFDTSIVAADMEVVELPTQRPIITGIHSRYRQGDIVNGNCSSDYSKPAANLTWWINDIQVPPNYLHPYEIQRHLAEHLESSVLGLNFVVTMHHFIKGRLKLKCSARIHEIYAQESEKLIEDDRPRIMASGRSPDMDFFPFDNGIDENGNELRVLEKVSSGCSTLTKRNWNLIRSLQFFTSMLLILLLPNARMFVQTQPAVRSRASPRNSASYTCSRAEPLPPLHSQLVASQCAHSCLDSTQRPLLLSAR